MTKDALYAGFAIFLAAEILFVIVAVVWETLKKRREASAKGSWGWMIGQAADGYTLHTDGVTAHYEPSVPVESLGRAE